MTLYDYPAQAFLGDHLRAAAGLAATGVPLAVLPLAWPVATLFAGLGALFLIFWVRTVRRQRERLEASEAGLVLVGARPRRLDWAELSALSLHYYSTHRGPSRSDGRGWMQLSLRGPAVRIAVDSRINGFVDLVRRAAAAARARDLVLGPTTEANLAALGVAT